MLNPRLQQVGQFVRKGSRLADIGTDHALLPVALVQNGTCVSAIASDIRKGPVAAATRTVTEANLADAIDIRLGDGLSTVTADEVDDIVIAGMGGETIAAILEAAPWTKNEHYRFILQPMTRAEKLRRYLWENGYDIEREVSVCDGHRCYTVLQVAFIGSRKAVEEALCRVGKLDPITDAAYLKTVKNRLIKQQRGDASALRLLERVQAYENGLWKPWE